MWDFKTETVDLNAGDNTITYQCDAGDSGDVHLDAIIVAEVVKPALVPTPTVQVTAQATSAPAKAATPAGTRIQHVAAFVAVIILGLVMCLQLLLAAGFPLGRAAWGGQHRILPTRLRWGSLAAVGILGVAVWVVLARAGFVAPGANSAAVRVMTWVFAAYLALNTVGNLRSKSSVERYGMATASFLLAVCFVLVALS
jgi:hypothetical protein